MNDGLRFPTAGVVILAASELGIKGTVARNLYYKVKQRQNEIEELEIQAGLLHEAAKQNVKRLAKKIPVEEIEKMSRDFVNNKPWLLANGSHLKRMYKCKEHNWKYGRLFGTNKGDRGAAYRQCTACGLEEYAPDEHSGWCLCERHPESTVVWDKPTAKRKSK